MAVALVIIFSILASVMLFVPRTAAASVSSPSPSQAPFRSLRIGVTALTAVTVNPNAITLLMEFVVVYNVYSTLVTRDGSYKIAPDLAFAWEVAPDNVTWTFHLVQNAYFTDPTNPTDRSHPVTADDVVFSYNLVATNSGSVLNSYTTQLASVTKVDTYTVQIVTKAPFAAMDSTLTAIPILPQYLWADVRNPVTQQPTPYPVGSGAMYLDPNSDLASTIIFRRNPNYYGVDAYCRISRPDEVRFLMFTSSTTMVNDFNAGTSELDAIFNIPVASFLTALDDPRITRMSVPGGFVGEFAINVMTDAQRDALVAAGFTQFRTGNNNQVLATNQVVRKAIAMSIDRQAIVDFAYLGLATVGDTLIPASNPWHLDIPAAEEYPFDTAAARQMLNDAGWQYDSTGTLNPGATPLYQKNATTGAAENGLIFRLYTPDSQAEFEPAVALISAWLRQSGFQPTDERGNPSPGYEVKPVNQMNSIWKALDYDVWLWDWIFSAVSDPSLDILQVQTTEAIGPTSDNGYSNATYDALYNESLVTVDEKQRRQLTDEMQRMLYDYASYIIPYYANDRYAVTSAQDLGYGWENWGNWTKSPGLVLDSDLPNLWFQVHPYDNPPPVVSAFPSVDFVAGSPAAVSVVALDPTGEPLTFTWDFGDGTASETTTTSSVPHTYAQPGQYTIKVQVKDSEWPVCATTTATISVAGANLPPSAALAYELPAVTGGISHGWVNESITFSVTVSDPEGDPLFVAWNFGDGTSATNLTSGATPDTPKVVSQAHVYSESGNFTLTVTVTDNQTGAGHVQTKTAVIPIWETPTAGPPPGPGPAPAANPWLNYGVPIAIALAIILGVAAVALRRRRMAKEEKRQEEGPPREQPPPPAP